jgi:hypothetical protein
MAKAWVFVSFCGTRSESQLHQHAMYSNGDVARVAIVKRVLSWRSSEAHPRASNRFCF